MNLPFPLKTDSYKVSHWRQYPPGTRKVYSYFESRGGKYDATTFFGLQGILKQHFVGPVVTREGIEEAAELYAAHFGDPNLFFKAGFEHILTAHGGKLPLSIRAVPEGTTVGVSNVLMTVENTCPECYWLTNFCETVLVQTWYPTTVATQSREIKKIIKTWLDFTGDSGSLDFKLHDFGFRGVSSVESAAIGGAAHLVNFKGTDTVAALQHVNHYYRGQGAAGFSIPAAEHSTITSWGRTNEGMAYANMLAQYPKGLVAVVSDSYDITNAVENIWGKELKDKVLARDGMLVVRPDSGNPVTIVCEVVTGLARAFGTVTNAKGFKLLDPHVRVIQGDGVNEHAIDDILAALAGTGYAADNLAFGMGGALLQKLDRDTQKFAFKCSLIEGDFGSRDVYKDPQTDHSKASKRGRLALRKNDGQFWTDLAANNILRDRSGDQLVEVFRDGQLLVDDSFDKIRERAAL